VAGNGNLDFSLMIQPHGVIGYFADMGVKTGNLGLMATL